jgi:hypothetical protein
MGVWITGDIHGEPERFSVDNFHEQKEFGSNQDENIAIIAGDFGLVWNKDCESKTEKYWLKWLEEKPFTTVFIDGNHENFPRLETYPIKEWHGGLVNEIRPHILRLRRGEVYVIEGKKFFTFGGASSHDISDGLFDCNDKNYKKKVTALVKKGKWRFRVNGLSWWKEELPSKEEMEHGIDTLEKHNWSVDYIITHSPPSSIIELIGNGQYQQDILTEYLEEIRSKLDYKYHIMGHMHVNQRINDKDILLYDQITPLL